MKKLQLKNFSTTAPGKWILAGEHAVLRGAQALVFPLPSKCLSLQYQVASRAGSQAQDNDLHLKLSGERGQEFELLFWGVLEKACEKAGIHRSDLVGNLKIESSIPIGSGLGASAALCVALTRWFVSFAAVPENQQYEFARSLEDLFHGESSGVDIAVALSGKGLLFQRGGERLAFEPRWFPRCCISYSGQRGVTVECVNKVKKLIEKDAEKMLAVDQRMRQAVQLAQVALTQASDLPLALSQLAESFRLAESCFEDWGLIAEEPRKHIQVLKEAGALAVKMTGSGDGGYVLSLWATEPPAQLNGVLIPCFC